jgi:VCBS repeat-containing protein
MTWTNDLNNDQLKSLSLEASSDNLFNYQEILSLLESAATGGITSSEWEDLKTIYTNAVDSFSSNYVKTITYNVIYTNPSNDKWWGGTTSAGNAQSLGNMSAGMSEQKASWLVDKWFLGLDLPMPVSSGDSATGNATSGTYGYNFADGQLFIDGAAASDISQGTAGTCYFLASMGAVANVSSDLIEGNFTDNGNGTYGVRFYIDGEEVYTTVNLEVPTKEYWSGTRVIYASNQDHSLDGEMWISLLEKAYAQINTQDHLGRSNWNGENSFRAVEGGLATPLQHLTNLDYTYYSSYYTGTGDQYASDTLRSTNANTYKQTIIDALEDGAIGWLGSWGNTVDASGKKELVGGHAFMILGYDSATDEFTLRNPWGDGGSSYIGEFQVSIEEFWNSSVKGIVALSEPVDTTPEPEQEFNYTISSNADSAENAVSEGDEITFTITRDTSGSISTVYLATSTGSADQTDFNGFTKMALEFEAHETSKTITVDTFFDNLDEDIEDFTLELYKESTDLDSTTSSTAYIANVEAVDYTYTLSTNADSSENGVSEGDEITLTITRSASGTDSTVYLSTNDISSIAGFDYIGLDHFALEFAEYETSKTLYLGTYHDSATEGDETFSIDLYENLSDGISKASTTAYINDKYLPSYSYTVQSSAGSPDTAIEEGETVTFTITRSGSGTEATVFVGTENVTAGDGDYEGMELQALTFAADQKVLTLEVETNEDWWFESDEYFTLNLYKNATDSTPSAYGAAFIADKVFSDYNYTIDNDSVVQEGDTVTFTINRDGSGSASTVYLSTDEGSAGSSDFESLNQLALDFTDYETSKTVTLNIYEDFDDEGNENFWLNLYHNKTDSGYAAQSEVTIENVTPQTDYNYTITDDSSLFSPTEEGGTITYTITRDGSGSESTVYLSTTHGTANDSDYDALDKYALEFASYETTKTITVDTYQDNAAETTEYFWLDLFKSYANAETGRYDAYSGAYIKNIDAADTETYDYTISSDAGYSSPATEGEGVTLTVTRSGTGSESTVYVKTHNGTAKSGSDFNGIASQAVVFAEYETSKTITLDTYQDSSTEYPEYFWASVYNGDPSTSGAGKALDSTLNYIQDTENSNFDYTITSDDRVVNEGQSITYTISRDGSGHASTVYLQTEDAGANSGSDYAGLSDYALNFATYETEKTITINTYEDSETEFVEGFWLQLFTTVGDIEQNNYAAYNWGQIEDGAAEEEEPEEIIEYNYSLSNNTTEGSPADEGDSITFTITRDNSGTASTVYLQTKNSTANGGTDYAALSAFELSFASYETSKTITIDTYQDGDIEGIESFSLELYKSNAELISGDFNAWSSAYIDDVPVKNYGYTLTVNNSPAEEGTALSFTITRDGSGSDSTVYLSTKNGSATSGLDFEGLSSYNLDFAAYETTKTISIDTYQDDLSENNEYFWLDLYTSVADAQSGNFAAYTSAIIEDAPVDDVVTDYNYTLSALNDTVDEGNNFTFIVTRSATGSASTVYLKTSDSTTNGGSDYEALSGYSVSFSEYETTKLVNLDTYLDDIEENEETFGLELYKTQADLLSGNIHTWTNGHITDKTESEELTYSYTIITDDSPVVEGETLSFTITRDNSGSESTVYLGSTDGTAEGGSDFTQVSAQSLTFAADETSKTFTIDTFEDIDSEGNESFWLNLYKTYVDALTGNIEGFTEATIENKAVITDFDYDISTSISLDNPVNEGNQATFTITRDNIGSESTVYLSTSDSTTRGELDYATLSAYELTFAADETTKTITIDTYQDNISEGQESFSLELYKSQADLQARDYNAWGTAYIEDTTLADYSYEVTSLNSPVAEGEALTFEISRNGSGSESTVYVSTSDDSATADSDYASLSTLAVEFGENETSKIISIDTYEDSDLEGDEYFWVDLYKTQADAQNNTTEAYSWGMIKGINEASSPAPSAANRAISTPIASEIAPETSAEVSSSQTDSSTPSYPGHSLGQFNNNYAFAAITTDGTVITWGNSDKGGDSSSVTSDLTDVEHISSNSSSFAALKTDGSVVTWGDINSGGDISSVSSNLNGNIAVTGLFSTEVAFAALREDGSVITWGQTGAGADSSSVASDLNGTLDVTNIYSNMSAFAAVRSDGSVITWGYDDFGGDSSSVSSELNGSTDVTQVFSTGSAFAALRSDGSVITWGNPVDGGDSSTVAASVNGSIDVSAIYATTSAFAALLTDGSVVTWGDINNGGNSDNVAIDLDGSLNVTDIISTNTAFAALRDDGSVISWGDNLNGGDSSTVASSLNGTTDVTHLYANESAFAALRSDGSVITWGNAQNGGDQSAVADELDGSIDIVDIVVTNNAFAALRSDGSVVTWGDTLGGGDSSQVSTSLDGTTDVVQIYSTGVAFAAIKEDGTVVTWGDFNYGGDSSSVADDLTNIASMSSINPSTPVTPNTAPVVTTPDTVTYTDTSADDTFTVTTNTLDVTDAESNTLSFTLGNDSQTQTGNYGSISLDQSRGEWTYTPDDGAIEGLKTNESDSFTVQVSDGVSTSTTTITIELQGSNDTASFTGDITGSVTADETTTASGSLTISDRDTEDSDIVSQTNSSGTYGSFSIDTSGQWNYALDNDSDAVQNLETDQVVTDSFTVTSDDGSTQNITITLNGDGEEQPTQVGSTITADEGDAAINGSISNEAATYTAANGQDDIAGLTFNSDGSYSFDANNAAYESLVEGETLEQVFNYQATNSQNETNTGTLTITLTGTNDTPIVNRSLENMSVMVNTAFSRTLNSTSFTDVDQDDLTYTATRSNGEALPDWLTFNASTLTFSGTADRNDLEDNITVRVSVSDDQNSTTFDEFSISLTSEDEQMSSTAEDDLIYGSDDTDTVLMSYLPSQYIYADNTLSGAEGDDSLSNIEYIGFGYGYNNDAIKVDVLLEDLIDPEGDEKSNAATMLDQISDLYIAYFGRAPDAEGLSYWFKELYTGSHTLERAATGFSYSEEYKATYPDGSSNRDFVESVYQNLFNRNPDSGGWNYWEGELNDGMARDSFLLNVINGAYAPTSGIEDRSLLDNKHDISVYYAEQSTIHPDEEFDSAINALLTKVTDDSTTEAAAREVIDYAFNNDVTLSGIMEDQTLLDQLWS